MTTLIFPATTPEAFAYFDEARRRGEAVVAAASVEMHEAVRRCGRVDKLPFIHDAAFGDAFSRLIAERRIDRIVAPVAAVHRFVAQWLTEREMAHVSLIGEGPIARQVRLVEEWMVQGVQLHPFVRDCAQSSPAVASPIAVAALLKQAMGIYGESDIDKLAAMIGIFARAVRGDVVEIGALMGRTAFLLLALARRHAVGPVLVIDPWDAQNARQMDSPEALRQVDDDWDHERLAQGFLLNWLPYAGADMNYLRMPSHEGYRAYRQGSVRSAELGATQYGGTIAVLHIDGNHDLAAVRRDCELWLPHLAPGGWLILDDYVWAHGRGPQIVGDELLQALPDVDCAFVAGKALFLSRANHERDA